MTEVEMALSHRNARNELLKLCMEGLEDMLKHDHVRAAALALAMHSGNFQVKTEVTLWGKQTLMRFYIEDKLGGKSAMFDLPVDMSDDGVTH